MSSAFIADKCDCGNYKRKSLSQCTVCSAKNIGQNYGMSAERLKAKAVENMTFDEAKAKNMVKEFTKAYPAFADFEGRN